MKKHLKIILIVLLIAITVLTFGCSKADNNGGYMNNSPEAAYDKNNDIGTIDDEFVSGVSGHKIIYKANVEMEADNPSDALIIIKSKMGESDWIESESIGKGTINVVFRIKTDNFNSFISSLSTAGEVMSLNRSGTDITTEYDNNVQLKESLTAERSRLVELMEGATMTDLISINQRISEIDSSLTKINNTLASYDSKLNYSTVNISIYKIYTPVVEEEPTFGQQIVNVFKGAWNALVGLFKGIIYVIVALVPFLIIIVPVGALIIYFVIRKKNRRNLQKGSVDKIYNETINTTKNDCNDEYKNYEINNSMDNEVNANKYDDKE